jgi:hypothetical protein
MCCRCRWRRTEGIRFGDPVAAWACGPEIEVGPALMGRVLNALGEPIDEGAAGVSQTLPLDGAVRSPLDRVPIRIPLGTGIRVLDALLTVGRGQRVGIFGGSGVGKSTLIGMMTRNTEADVTVVGLVGERGREVGEFLEDALGGGPGAVGGGGFNLRPVAADAHAGGAGGNHGGGVLCRAGKACAAGSGFADPLSPWRRGRLAWRPESRPRPRGIRLRSLPGWRGWWSAPGSFAWARSPPFTRC